MISTDVLESRAPVGSSARIMSGLVILPSGHLVGVVARPFPEPQAVKVFHCQFMAPVPADSLVEQGKFYVLDGGLETYEVI